MVRGFKNIILHMFIILVFPTMIGVIGYVEKVIEPEENGTKITVLNHVTGVVEEMDLETYLKGVVAAEMPALFHIEALKAQAVAARTYAMNKKGEDIPEHNGAKLCTDSTHCKAFSTFEQLKSLHGDEWISNYWGKITDSVDQTKNEIIVYEDQPIDAVFHSTGSGFTQDSRDVWGGDLPYLKSVESVGDMESPKFASTVALSMDEFKDKISSANPSCDFSKPIAENIDVGSGGAVRNITIFGCQLTGNQVRGIFSLNSSVFQLRQDGESVVFDVKGTGHGVGMSQYGANYLANHGTNYIDILKTYYTGVEIKKL